MAGETQHIASPLIDDSVTPQCLRHAFHSGFFRRFHSLFDGHLPKASPASSDWLDDLDNLTAVIFWAQLQSGGGFGAWSTAAISLTCFIAFICSFFYGDKSITRFDIICLGLSLIAMGLWLICKTPLYCVVLLTFVEYLGLGAMTRKTYLDPYSENLTYFILCIVKYVFAAMALDVWSWITAFYPVAIIIQASAFSLMIIYRRWQIKGLKPALR